MSIAKIAITFERDSTYEDQYKLIKNLFSKGFHLNLIDVKYNKNMGLLIIKNFDKLNSFVFSNLKKESQIIHNNVQTRVDYMQSFNPRHVKTKENKHLELGDFELLENEKFVKNINEF